MSPEKPFRETVFYTVNDPDVLRHFGKSTLAKWRMAGHGPRYFKAGHKILYPGAELNAALALRRKPKGRPRHRVKVG